MTSKTYPRILQRVLGKADGQDESGLLAWLGQPLLSVRLQDLVARRERINGSALWPSGARRVAFRLEFAVGRDCGIGFSRLAWMCEGGASAGASAGQFENESAGPEQSGGDRG